MFPPRATPSRSWWRGARANNFTSFSYPPDLTSFQLTYSGTAAILQSLNSAPILAPFSNRTLNVGQNLGVTSSATDPDGANTLTFSLPAAPSGAVIVPASGLITWRPGAARADTTNLFRVVVADNGSPSLSATQTFQVMVNSLAPVRLQPLAATPGAFAFEMTGEPGPDYTLIVSSNLAAPNWASLLTTNLTGGVCRYTNLFPAGTETQRFYRVLIGP